MSRLDDLIRRQHETWTRMNDILTRAESEDRDLTAEERTNWDAANTALDDLDGDIRRLQSHGDRQRVDRSTIAPTGGSEPVEGDGEHRDAERAEQYRSAFWSYMRRGLSNVTAEHRQLLEANHQELPDVRAQGGSLGSAGGFLVNPEFRDAISEVLKAYGGLLAYANVVTTETGAPLSWPTSDDISNEGQILAENTQIAEQDLTLGQRQVGAYTYTSRLVRVSWQLLNDNAFDLEAFLARKFGERLGRIQARHLVSGTGSSQPTGILTGLRAGATTPTGATQSITYDNLIDLEHSVDPAYRESGNCRFGFADSVLRLLRKLKDADGRPLWQPVPAPGFPATINGHPYFVDNSMPTIAAGGVAAIFGDFRAGMLVRQVQGIQSVRLSERYADLLQTGFFAFSRMDARPDDPNALAGLFFGPAA